MKRLIDSLYGLGSPWNMSVFADDEPLGLIELDDNLDDIEKPEELPPGTYRGEVQDVQKQTSGKGNQYFAIKFVIPPEEIPADVTDSFPDGATLYWNRQVVPNGKDRRAMYNLKKLIQSLGLSTQGNSFDPNEWMGCTANLRVGFSVYQGEQRAEIKAVEAAESAAPKRGAAPSRGAARRAPADDEGEDESPAPRRRQAAGGARRR